MGEVDLSDAGIDRALTQGAPGYTEFSDHWTARYGNEMMRQAYRAGFRAGRDSVLVDLPDALGRARDLALAEAQEAVERGCSDPSASICVMELR